MSTTTFSSAVRSGKPGSPGNVSLNAEISFDPTQVSTGTGFILPAGSVVTGITSLGGATGGTAPTVDIGTLDTADLFGPELDADTPGIGTVGAGAFVKLTADTEVYAGVGASAATGGMTTISIQYYRT